MNQNVLAPALESIYASLHADNKDIDANIINLKKAMYAAGIKTVDIDPVRLPQPNRQGRKVLQSYFKHRGVTVKFIETAQAS